MKDSLSIITHWIESAHKRNLTDHLVHFWIARDILERELSISKDRREACINFIDKYVSSSDEKNTVLQALKERTI